MLQTDYQLDAELIDYILNFLDDLETATKSGTEAGVAYDFDLVFKFEYDGCQLKTVDPSHVMMVDIHIPRELFDTYDPRPGPGDTIYLGTTRNTLQNTDYGDTLKVQRIDMGEEEAVSVTQKIMKEQKGESEELKAEINGQTIEHTGDQMEPSIPNIDTPVTFKLNSTKLDDVIDTFSRKHGSMIFRHIPAGGLVMGAESDVEGGFSAERSEIQTFYIPPELNNYLEGYNQEARSIFSLDYMAPIFNAVRGDLTLSMGTDFPILLDWDAFGDMDMKVYTAPRIEGGEETDQDIEGQFLQNVYKGLELTGGTNTLDTSLIRQIKNTLAGEGMLLEDFSSEFHGPTGPLYSFILLLRKFNLDDIDLKVQDNFVDSYVIDNAHTFLIHGDHVFDEVSGGSYQRLGVSALRNTLMKIRNGQHFGTLGDDRYGKMYIADQFQSGFFCSQLSTELVEEHDSYETKLNTVKAVEPDYEKGATFDTENPYKSKKEITGADFEYGLVAIDKSWCKIGLVDKNDDLIKTVTLRGHTLEIENPVFGTISDDHLQDIFNRVLKGTPYLQITLGYHGTGSVPTKWKMGVDEDDIDIYVAPPIVEQDEEERVRLLSGLLNEMDMESVTERLKESAEGEGEGVEVEEEEEKPERKFDIDDRVGYEGEIYVVAHSKYDSVDKKWKYDLNDPDTGKRLRSSVPEEGLEKKEEEPKNIEDRWKYVYESQLRPFVTGFIDDVEEKTGLGVEDWEIEGRKIGMDEPIDYGVFKDYELTLIEAPKSSLDIYWLAQKMSMGMEADELAESIVKQLDIGEETYEKELWRILREKLEDEGLTNKVITDKLLEQIILDAKRIMREQEEEEELEEEPVTKEEDKKIEVYERGTIDQEEVDDMFDILSESEESGKEIGTSLCLVDGEIELGDKAIGEKAKLKIDEIPKGKKGEDIGTFHTHPGGPSVPTPMDQRLFLKRARKGKDEIMAIASPTRKGAKITFIKPNDSYTSVDIIKEVVVGEEEEEEPEEEEEMTDKEMLKPAINLVQEYVQEYDVPPVAVTPAGERQVADLAADIGYRYTPLAIYIKGQPEEYPSARGVILINKPRLRCIADNVPEWETFLHLTLLHEFAHHLDQFQPSAIPLEPSQETLEYLDTHHTTEEATEEEIRMWDFAFTKLNLSIKDYSEIEKKVVKALEECLDKDIQIEEEEEELESRIKTAETTEEKLDILKQVKEEYPNMYGYYSRVCLPLEDVRDKDTDKRLRCWLNSLRNELDRFQKYSNPLQEAEEDHETYQKAVDEISREEWDELVDEGYEDAKAYLLDGDDIDRMISIEEPPEEVPDSAPRPSSPRRVPYTIGWNNAIDDHEKGKLEKKEEEPPVTEEEVEEKVEEREELAEEEVPEAKEAVTLQGREEEGYEDAKEYLDEGTDIEKRELADWKGESQKEYDRGWNKAIEEYEGGIEIVEGAPEPIQKEKIEERPIQKREETMPEQEAKTPTEKDPIIQKLAEFEVGEDGKRMELLEGLNKILEEQFNDKVIVSATIDSGVLYLSAEPGTEYETEFEREPQMVFERIDYSKEDKRLEEIVSAVDEFEEEIMDAMGVKEATVEEVDVPARKDTIPIKTSEQVKQVIKKAGAETQVSESAEEFLTRMIESGNRVITNPYEEAVIELVGLEEDKHKIKTVIDRWNLGAKHDVAAQSPSFSDKYPKVSEDLVAFQFWLPKGQSDDARASGYALGEIFSTLKDELVIATRSPTVGAKIPIT